MTAITPFSLAQQLRSDFSGYTPQADTGGLESCTSMLEQDGTQPVICTILGSQEFYQDAQ